MQGEVVPEARRAGLALVYQALGRVKDSDALVPAFERDYPVAAARVHAVGHHNDEAFASLEKAYAAKDTELYRIKSDPFLRSLEGDPRYKAFLGKMNLPE